MLVARSEKARAYVRDDTLRRCDAAMLVRRVPNARQRFVPFCSMKVSASITVRKPPREPSMFVSALE
jgi:hypothetical protein